MRSVTTVMLCALLMVSAAQGKINKWGGTATCTINDTLKTVVIMTPGTLFLESFVGEDPNDPSAAPDNIYSIDLSPSITGQVDVTIQRDPSKSGAIQTALARPGSVPST